MALWVHCEYFLNPEKLLFDAAIISCSSSLCFLHPSSHPSPVVTPYCCPYSLLIKSKLFSITFKALQNLTPIQPSNLTFYFPCSILYTSHYLDHYLGNWTMFSNASALDSFYSGVSFACWTKRDIGAEVCRNGTLWEQKGKGKAVFE